MVYQIEMKDGTTVEISYDEKHPDRIKIITDSHISAVRPLSPYCVNLIIEPKAQK